MNWRISMIAISIIIAALQGCAMQEPPVRDPGYAPTMPPAPVSPRDNNGSIYQASNSVGLFEDVKAHRVGDILTIKLVESTNASKSATTTTKKTDSIDTGTPTLLGSGVVFNGVNPLNNSLSSSNNFAGDGASTQSNTLTGNITVTVAKVLSNGNLIVRGQKILTLNHGDEYIRISGIVRPADIGADNSVLSTQIANADISYSGRGTLADTNRMGWLARFFNSSWWPF